MQMENWIQEQSQRVSPVWTQLEGRVNSRALVTSEAVG